jgi:hypothetical protein
MDQIPIRQLALGRLAASNFDDQAIEAMDKDGMELVPAFVFGNFLFALVAIPLLFQPVVATKEWFDGIAQLKIQKQAGALFGLNLPLPG